jgi:hypothetical protein
VQNIISFINSDVFFYASKNIKETDKKTPFGFQS